MAKANQDSQREFLSLIRDLSNRKSHGDRRVSDLKQRMLDLTSHLQSANSHLHLAKQSRQTAEHDLRATQLHLHITSASIPPLQARARILQDQISTVASHLNALKNKEDAEREDFKTKMLQMNATIREFRELPAQTASKQHSPGPGLPLSTVGEFTKPENSMPDAEESFKGLQENFKCINAEMQMLEAEYEKQLHEHTEVSKELGNLRRKRILVAAIIEESKLLQELAGYPLFTNDVSCFYQKDSK
ncbi:hypothetical protein LUZ63_004602 [Rhynchospora breviuscula]|uniref:Uncharacterized protein n=1 Tax=Rhynchospora breviuscula TaxID=2022672 RepID=A0A9Q0HSA6_9POAL|nr:hypothetical protein LUZ63_004602 [Rhynchospora breviuscula]